MQRKSSYNTKARQEISDFLKQNGTTAVSAADICQHLQSIGNSVNPTTVYRYLDRLCAEKTIIKYIAEKGEKAVYQYSGQKKQCSEHLHLKCTQCGRILHLDCGFMQEFQAHLREHHDFELQCEGSVLYGLCSDCRKKQNAN